MCNGRLSHSPGPAAANALSPKVPYVRVTTHVWLTVERSRRSWASATRRLIPLLTFRLSTVVSAVLVSCLCFIASSYSLAVVWLWLCFVLHKRPTSTVHLAGSFVIGHVLTAIRHTGEQERCDNVSMLVSLTPRVLLLCGIETVTDTCPAGYGTDVHHIVSFILTSRCMKSSDHMTLHQVQDIIMLLYVALSCKF